VLALCEMQIFCLARCIDLPMVRYVNAHDCFSKASKSVISA
jgi:hypothetical protein